MTTATRNAKEVTVRHSRAMQQAAAAAESALASQVTADDVKAMIENQLQAALDQALTSGPELAGPQGWWDLYAYGPIKPGAHLAGHLSGPLLPNGILRAGEKAYIVTILVLNPFGPTVPTATEILAGFRLPYEVTYQAGNVTEWKKGPASLNKEHYANLVPGQSFYVDVLEFVAEGDDEVIYEMNISARIFDCAKQGDPPFAGFARETIDIDPGLFTPAPGLGVRPIRFMVYGRETD